MASLDEELLKDAQEDAEAVAYILSNLPAEAKGKFNEEQVYYFLDLLSEYYAESDILEAEPDSEGFVDIDIEKVATHLKDCAAKDKIGDFEVYDLMCLVNAELDFSENSI